MRGSILSPLGKREQTKARNRAVILAAPRKVFGALGYEATRQMLNRGVFDAEEAARFCTRFTLGGVVPAAKSWTPTSTSLNGKKRRTA